MPRHASLRGSLVAVIATALCTVTGALPAAAQPPLPEVPLPGLPALGDIDPAPQAELFGGGRNLFPDRRFVALYGHPSGPALGAFGEQDTAASIARVRDLAAQYQQFSAEPVLPAFEIIATVASADPGTDGRYTRVTPPDGLRAVIDEAEAAGVYVVLDLQPGHASFPEQARIYEEFLARPNVGLALDPEWRLAPGQRHMVQIGSVDASEVNEVITYLSELVQRNALPQKMLILHQFRTSMITSRELVDTGRPEVAVVLHADGHGSAPQKFDTWNALQQGLPPRVHMAWKNFYDEDSPTFTPAETMAIEPQPVFVSYQ
ncbi:sugar phosphate isomerase/epimerase [Rhodococcus yananensis]|uniref:sugar phosphate isomerase/epimerase n=1 Tax=Rhodococcus yananensis TaxID=2879464 RepID=UPI001CF7F8F6|nr:sugar phosphate isomerase/epimerase [Rhodococcus yananensis]